MFCPSRSFFSDFRNELLQMRSDMKNALATLRQEGKSLAAYGAAAKATTLLGFFGLTSEDISFVVDKSVWKQGLEMPGTGIRIVPPERLRDTPPDVVLILAWNFAREIMSENRAFAAQGGTFLVPVPRLREVELNDAGVSL